jgi:hypothetical protein
VFITPFGAYAYTTMSFELKNAGATYQRAIQLCLADQLHRNVEAYVDDVVIKTRSHDEFISDLEETFNSLRLFRWKLNLIKVRLWRASRQTTQFHCKSPWDRSKSGEDQHHHSHGCSKNDQGRPESHRLYGSFESIHLLTWRKGTTLLQIAQAP